MGVVCIRLAHGSASRATFARCRVRAPPGDERPRARARHRSLSLLFC